MSAMVDAWVGELTKLTEKVLAHKPLMKLSKDKEVTEVEKEAKKKENMGDSSTMSEATVCLLMDRFVPW
ncbi:hypothetical protein Lal_00019515 [Lupinus albus]|uniref:Uncharacterized protein n=1 Tax=Lupinus albus TaxID=3870 RepID=A0A6A5PMZ4_LUPAL|nr:hypothetical protein Lalb_Chr01g0002971 [Lupinus albus]KAF1899387.1 hypothetical protein Lal_00019515 [Lupinus albus]